MWSIWSLLGNDCICQPLRLQDLQNPRGLDRVGGPVVCQWCIEDLTKGSVVLLPVSSLELPKVMGLKGVNHPDALHHFARLTFCPWCGKKGQNKGTMINHLWTTYYKLGLVCNQCLYCPSITLEALWHHGQGCKQSKGSGIEEEDGGAWWCVHIQLTDPKHPIQPEHYLSRWP